MEVHTHHEADVHRISLQQVHPLGNSSVLRVMKIYFSYINVDIIRKFKRLDYELRNQKTWVY